METFELAEAAQHTRSDHPPAMCFLDISGYTRLTGVVAAGLPPAPTSRTGPPEPADRPGILRARR